MIEISLKIKWTEVGKLDQDPSSDFLYEGSTSSTLVILLTNRQTYGQTNGHDNNTSMAEVIITLSVI